MTTKNTRAEDRQALERLLEVFGADRTRWPARERLRFASLVCEDDAARRLLAESAALDALLDRAPRASEDRERALKERIVAAALRSGEPSLAVVASTAPKASHLPAFMRGARLGPSRLGPSGNGARASREWSAAALLAASLVFGVMLGSTGTLDATVQEVAEATGLATAAETSQLALGEDVLTISDEELL